MNFNGYQQPLHHIISAIWLKINTLCGIDIATSEEGIQVLTAIYSSLIMLIVYCILREMNVKDIYKIIVMLIVAIHPTFIILSGSINNDIITVMFTFLATLYLIKWYKNTNWKNTIILALLTALCALSKISGTIIAFPIAFVFIYKFIKDFRVEKSLKGTVKKYILKFVVFGIIALTLGLSYSIRNKLLFNQELFYVPKPLEAQNCKDSLFNRFNIFSDELLKNDFCTIGRNGRSDIKTDSNIIAYIIKSSLFGEFGIKKGNIIVPIMLKWVNVIIILISMISLFYVLFRKNIKNKIYFWMFFFLWIGYIIMYMYGNITLPFTCTMDFRYLVPTIVSGMIYIIYSIMRFEKTKIYKPYIISVYIISIIFALLTVTLILTNMNYFNII